MADINELKRKFPSKDSVDEAELAKHPMHRKSSKASVNAIRQEYELKRSEVADGGFSRRLRPIFFSIMVIGLILILWFTFKGVF